MTMEEKLNLIPEWIEEVARLKVMRAKEWSDFWYLRNECGQFLFTVAWTLPIPTFEQYLDFNNHA